MPPDPADQATDRSRLVHREIIRLVALMAIAVAAFFGTRSFAISDRAMNANDAAEWHARGQQELNAGQIARAIDAFRNAVIKKRGDKIYTLSLARALAGAEQYDAAERQLLTLREASPEDIDINVQLARLAASRKDVTEAARYYDSALYAPWPDRRAQSRRDLRLELIRFLLMNQQTDRALSELHAVSRDVPDEPAAQTEIARLFAQAGDPTDALDHFTSVLHLDAANIDARAGAGEAAFRLGDYALARKHLMGLPAATEDVKDMQQIADLVISKDPLADRLTTVERQRRLREDFEYARDRLAACSSEQRGATPTESQAALQHEVQAFAARLKPPRIRESETVDAAIDLVYRIEQEIATACPPSMPMDRALMLIGRRHGADAR
jgi:tetratricopeptide (TPR) repeat protein